jgi:hypothetical protein
MAAPFLADLVAFSHLQFSQIRGHQPYLNVRKILYVIRAGHAARARRRGDRMMKRREFITLLGRADEVIE